MSFVGNAALYIDLAGNRPVLVLALEDDDASPLEILCGNADTGGEEQGGQNQKGETGLFHDRAISFLSVRETRGSSRS